MAEILKGRGAMYENVGIGHTRSNIIYEWRQILNRHSKKDIDNKKVKGFKLSELPQYKLRADHE